MDASNSEATDTRYGAGYESIRWLIGQVVSEITLAKKEHRDVRPLIDQWFKLLYGWTADDTEWMTEWRKWQGLPLRKPVTIDGKRINVLDEIELLLSRKTKEVAWEYKRIPEEDARIYLGAK